MSAPYFIVIRVKTPVFPSGFLFSFRNGLFLHFIRSLAAVKGLRFAPMNGIFHRPNI